MITSQPQSSEQRSISSVKAISQFRLKYFLLHGSPSPLEALGGVKLKLHIFKSVAVIGSLEDQGVVHFLSSTP
jgi:hypothetical protein